MAHSVMFRVSVSPILFRFQPISCEIRSGKFPLMARKEFNLKDRARYLFYDETFWLLAGPGIGRTSFLWQFSKSNVERNFGFSAFWIFTEER